MSPQPSGSWPPAGGNWEGGTVYGSRRLYHEPHAGWRDDGPVHTASPFVAASTDPARTSRVWNPTGTRIHYGGRYPARRHLLARWAGENRARVVTGTAVFVVLGYAATVLLFFERAIPTFRSAGALVGVGAVLVALLLSVVLWSRRE